MNIAKHMIGVLVPMVGKKQLVLWLNEKTQNNYLKEKKKTWVTLIGWLPSRNITSCTLWAN